MNFKKVCMGISMNEFQEGLYRNFYELRRFVWEFLCASAKKSCRRYSRRISVFFLLNKIVVEPTNLNLKGTNMFYCNVDKRRHVV